MTKEEKQKAIDALKISAPVIPVTQEKFMDYVQTINKIIDWLEQDPKFIAKSDGTIEQIKKCNDCLFKKEWEKIGKLISVVLEKQTEQEPYKVSEYDKDHIWYKGMQYISLRRFLEVKSEEKQKREAKTGHWIVHPKGIYAHLVCDKCLSNAPYDCRTNYCPNCGAKMVEEEE